MEPRFERWEGVRGTLSDSDELVRRPGGAKRWPRWKMGSLGMGVQEQIDKYIGDQLPPKRAELEELHRRITATSPKCKLWFLDGRNSEGRIVSNPNIGYGSTTIKYANGERREFYQVGVSANLSGISVYIMGLDDKKYLSETYGKKLGKAKITGYCIKFKSTKDVDIETIEEIIADAMTRRPT